MPGSDAATAKAATGSDDWALVDEKAGVRIVQAFAGADGSPPPKQTPALIRPETATLAIIFTVIDVIIFFIDFIQFHTVVHYGAAILRPICNTGISHVIRLSSLCLKSKNF